MSIRNRVCFLVGVLNTLIFCMSSGQPVAEQIVGDSIGSRRSDIEFLIGVSQIIEKDKDRLNKLRGDSVTLEPAFVQLTNRFYTLDKTRDSLQRLPLSPRDMASINYQWKYLRDILDFLLDRRQTMELQRRILGYKIAKEEEVLDFFMKGQTYAILEATLRKDSQDSEKEKQSEAVPDGAKAKQDSARAISKSGDENDVDEFDWSVMEIERDLEVLEARFAVSKKIWLFLGQLLALNEDDLFLARELAKKSSVLQTKWESDLRAMHRDLNEMIKSDSVVGLRDELRKSLRQIAPLEARMKNNTINDSLLVSDIEFRLQRLRAIQSPLTAKVQKASTNIEKKKRRLRFMTSPFAPHRIWSFIVNNGPRILFLIFMFVVTYFALVWLITAIIPKVRFNRYRSEEEQRERAETLRRAFRSGLTIIILVVGGITLLSEFGLDVSVLLGGAAVFSLAIAFGAQSLIKDYFSGLMIISENQYRVGNVVNINDVSGVVEDITLRMTILRDVEGVAHFIPHSEIKIVSNLGYAWSQVALDIKIDYAENVDYVMDVIMDVAAGLAKDTQFSKFILKDPEMLGVDSFGDSSIIVKILVKTPPLKQWTVKRELLRRIKNRFDQEGIKIPLPYQRIYYAPGEGIASHQEEDIKEEPHGRDRNS